MKLVRIGGMVAVLATVAALAAACGRAGATGAGPAPSSSARAAAFQAYASCMKQHGVTITVPSGAVARDRSARPSGSPRQRPTAFPSGLRPSGGFGGYGGFPGMRPSGVDDATWTAAQQACSALLPNRSGVDDTAMRAYRTCLSDHGVNASAGPGRFNTADPKVAAAMKVCEPLRPTAFPRRDGAPGSPGTPTPTPAPSTSA